MIGRGTQVVCIIDDWDAEEYPITCPKINQIYTVREIRLTPEDQVQCSILLEEIRNEVMQWKTCACEPHFDIRGFRPVKKTDISMFNSMLAPQEMELLGVKFTGMEVDYD